MTIHKALHPRNDVERLYVSGKERGGGLTSTEYSIKSEVHIKKRG